jgi:hypothetical protein
VRTVNFEIGTRTEVSGRLTHDLFFGSRVLIATECAGCPPAPARLRAVMTSNQIPFLEVNDRGTWLSKLRSGAFNLYVGYGIAPPESGTAFKELNEAVWLGDGLIFITSHPDAMPSLRESLGLDFQGTLTALTSISLLSPLQPATVSAPGTGVFVKLQGAQSLGTPTGTPNRVVAASRGVGLGKSLTLGWDTEGSNSDALYLSSLAAASPASGTPVLPGSLIELRALVANTGTTTTTYTVTHALPAGLTTTEPLTHTVTLAPAGSGAFLLPLLLPGQAGAFNVTGILTVGASTVDTNTFTVSVARSRDQIAADVVAALRALSLNAAQANKRDHAVDDVIQAGNGTPDAAIGLVLDAIDLTRQITAADTTAIRIDLARLLRAHQLGWQP